VSDDRREPAGVPDIGPQEQPSGDPESGDPELIPGRHRVGAPHDDRRRRGARLAGRSLVAVFAVLILAATGTEWAIKSSADAGIQARSVQAVDTSDSNIDSPSATTSPESGTVATHPAESILLLGSDSRAGANGNAGNDNGSVDTSVSQSDTLMVAHISADRQHVTVLSIPRDLEIPAPSCKQWSNGVVSNNDQPISRGEMWKITNAYAVGGPACTVKAVQQLTGLRIDRVIGIDFVGFQAMVDAVGGVRVNVCQPIIDAELGTVIPTAGDQLIHGDTALSLVRARKVAGDPTGDLGRIRRQQVVLSALLRQVTSAGTLLSPARLNAFLQAFVQNTYTDNVTVDDLVTLAQSFGTPDPSKVTFYTLPTHISEVNPDGLALDTSAAAPVFHALVNDQLLPGEVATDAAAPTSATPPATDSGVEPLATQDQSPQDQSPQDHAPSSVADLSAVNAGQPQCA